ncbi:hypothetical protein JZ751_013922, partial [Albula glossodonta]
RYQVEFSQSGCLQEISLSVNRKLTEVHKAPVHAYIHCDIIIKIFFKGKRLLNWIPDSELLTKCSSMDPAEELCKKLISWLQLRKRCADQLQMLAKELDNIQDGVRVTKLVGSTMAVTGSLAVLGAGLLTVCTGGLGAPALAMASGGLVGAATGTATSAIASLVDELVSSNKMKKAQGMLEEDKNLGNDIQNLLEELKQMSGSTDPKEQEIELSMHIMRGFAKMRNLNFSDSLLYALLVPEGLRIGINSNVEAICFNTSLKGLMFGIAMTGLKTTAKGMSKVVLAGGAIGLVFSLPELVQTSMELAKGDISESVKTLQDAAYNIREAVSRYLKKYPKFVTLSRA